MRVASIPAAIAGVIVAGFFAVRAASGVPAVWAYEQGLVLAAEGRYAEAGPLIDRGAVGADRAVALWRSGRTRLDSWHTLPASERRGPRGDETLREVTVRYLGARIATPGPAWPTAELGYVYNCRERSVRSRRIVDLAALDRGPWSLLGDDGRIAIGLTRAAIDREPNSYEMRDQLVLLLEENGLREDAVRAMVEAARVLPDFGAHPDFVFESLPRDLAEAFWRTSRSLGPADAPFLSQQRHLLSLGQLGRRLGHLDEAEQDLRAAMNAPGTTTGNAAEDAFHLGLVLIDLGRLEEAETLLAQALREPVFGPGVADARARIAIRRERWSEALEHLREARRLRPRELWVLLDFAAVAQKVGAWDQAEESLRFAMLVHPEDPAPHRAMIAMYLAKGEKGSARRALDEFIRSFGRTEDVARIERTMAEPLDPARP